MAFSKMVGFEVMPETPRAMRASSSPEVISERRMKSSQTDWPSSFNSLILLMGALLEQDRRNGR
jgi:hypothetical protein